MDEYAGMIFKNSKFGVHKYNEEEIAVLRKAKNQKVFNSLDGIPYKKTEYNADVEYYIIETGVIFKKEKYLFYRLDIDNQVWIYDPTLIDLYNGSYSLNIEQLSPLEFEDIYFNEDEK